MYPGLDLCCANRVLAALPLTTAGEVLLLYIISRRQIRLIIICPGCETFPLSVGKA